MRQCRNTLAPAAVALLLVFSSCRIGPEYPPDVAAALEAAGDNRSELERVIEHYRNLGDTLKLQAAYFLIANMPGHSYARYRLYDTAGATVTLDVLAFPDYDSLRRTVEAIERERGELDYERTETIEDISVITADYLIADIDLAFQVWREKPWARGLPFEQFKQYVLPYRGSNEPLEPWRETFVRRYADLAGRLEDSTDPIAAAAFINSDLKSWFTFDPRFYFHPTDQGLLEMMTTGLGRCEDMTNLAIYAMRAVGLAVTSDFTPYWANAGNNHAWNAIVTPDGRVVPFMGCEADPGRYRLWNKLAKVYRKTFAEQPDNLVFQRRKQDVIPRFLDRPNYIDVTPDYVPTATVTVPLTRPAPDSVDIAYLCVFNSGHWRAIDWGRIENDRVTFRNIGTDIMYLPALYLNEEIVSWGDPFVPRSDTDIVVYRPDRRNVTVTVVSTTRKSQQASSESIRKSFLTPGTNYELFYWDDGWQSAGTQTAGDTPLTFDRVPAGALYWLVAENSNREERIFTVDSGRQVWW